MRMRKYLMGSPRAKRLNRLLRNERVSVRKTEVVAHGNREDVVYVFFDYVEEEKTKDTAALKQLKAKAAEVAEDKIYKKLSNSKQRELYLLDRYALAKRESADVIELVKMIEIGAKIDVEERIKEDAKEYETIQGSG